MGAVEIAPPFDSNRQAVAFLGLLFGLLALPFALDRLDLPPRAAVYSAIPAEHGAFSFIRHEIFDRSGKIDILFLGSSQMWVGIDPVHVKRVLERRIGRPATVLSFGTNWRKEDLLYTLLTDLLARRSVKLLILDLPQITASNPDEPHIQAYRWLRPPEVFAGSSAEDDHFDLRHREAMAASVILGGPRKLLSALRSDLVGATVYDEDLGAYKVRQGLAGHPFVAKVFAPLKVGPDSMTSSSAAPGRFHFADRHLPDYERHFLLRILALAERNGVRVASLSFPRLSEAAAPFVPVPLNWKAETGRDIPVIGIPPRELYSALSEADRELIHYDGDHLNQNGNQLFTETITPAILELWSKSE